MWKDFGNSPSLFHDSDKRGIPSNTFPETTGKPMQSDKPSGPSRAFVGLLAGVCLGMVVAGVLSYFMSDGRNATLNPEVEDGRVLSRLEAIESMLQGLASKIAATAESDQRMASAPRAAEEERVAAGESDVSETKEMRKELGQLFQAMDSLRAAVTKGMVPGRYPSIDMIRGASNGNNWNELDILLLGLATSGAEKARAQDSVRWMTQQEVLDRFGRPQRIFPDGGWGYLRPQPLNDYSHITLRFVEDYVVDVEIGDGPDWYGR